VNNSEFGDSLPFFVTGDRSRMVEDHYRERPPV
jgi:hypothetical protein